MQPSASTRAAEGGVHILLHLWASCRSPQPIFHVTYGTLLSFPLGLRQTNPHLFLLYLYKIYFIFTFITTVCFEPLFHYVALALITCAEDTCPLAPSSSVVLR